MDPNLFDPKLTRLAHLLSFASLLKTGEYFIEAIEQRVGFVQKKCLTFRFPALHERLLCSAFEHPFSFVRTPVSERGGEGKCIGEY